MGIPVCEVCVEKVDYVKKDYECINIEVHKKCLENFYILQSGEVSVTKKDIELAKANFNNYIMYGNSENHRKQLEIFFERLLRKAE